MREVMNGVMYVLSTGCQWRYIPKDLPPRSTVHGYFYLWGCDGTLEKIHHALYVECREKAEREASPTACIIDSQSVKSAEKGGPAIDPHGFDAGKLIKGKKRHILVDMLGLMLHAMVIPLMFRIATAASAVATLFGQFPFLAKAVRRQRLCGADFPATASPKPCPTWRSKSSNAPISAKGFVVVPKRWIVERTIAWFNRCRRLAKDWENLNRNALAFLRLASIRLMLRKLCNPS